jgi:hypothetical protein
LARDFTARTSLGLRLLSVGIALGLFLFVRGERQVEHRYTTRIEVQLPDGLTPATRLPSRLSVTLSGPWARLRSLKGSTLGPVTLDLSQTGPGITSWFVRPESLRLPPGVRVESIYPSQGTVELLRGGLEQTPSKP